MEIYKNELFHFFLIKKFFFDKKKISLFFDKKINYFGTIVQKCI